MGRTPPRVLLADPDLRTHALVAELFQRNHEVVAVSDGRAGMDAYREIGPAVLITEQVLAGVDGLTLARHARRSDPQMVIIVWTGEPSARGAATALRFGVDDYVLKHGDSITHLRETVRVAQRRRMHQTEVERLMVELTELNEAFLETMASLQKANLALEERLRAPKEEPDVWRVLVVDDDVAIVALLETLLRSQGFDVEGASSGADARAILSERAFDLVITDKNLGDANGLDLIREIRERTPDTQVLLMTGFATVESAVEAMHYGAVGYLRKPFSDLDVVVNRVDEVRVQARAARAEQRYLHAFRARNADFLARYRLLKTKLTTLQKSRPGER